MSSQQAAAARAGYWFPLLLFGGLIALSVPLSERSAAPFWTGFEPLTAGYPTVMEAMYLGGGSITGPSPFPLGWYWAGVLAAGVLATAAWYRWRDGRAGGRTPLAGYLVSGLALAAVTTALPLAGWGTPVTMVARSTQAPQGWTAAWAWLYVCWQQGTFALLAVAVGLAVLARAWRSRVLAVITAVYAGAVCFSGLYSAQRAFSMPVFYAVFPFGNRAVMLPATVLLLAGLGALLTSGLRAWRSRSVQ